MNEENEHDSECSLESGQCDQDDSICCCYIMDEEGRYDDPCFTPIEDMCCC